MNLHIVRLRSCFTKYHLPVWHQVPASARERGSHIEAALFVLRARNALGSGSAEECRSNLVLEAHPGPRGSLPGSEG
jgi:hypothetical protein